MPVVTDSAILDGVVDIDLNYAELALGGSFDIHLADAWLFISAIVGVTGAKRMSRLKLTA